MSTVGKVIVVVLALFGVRHLWIYGSALWDYFGPERKR